MVAYQNIYDSLAEFIAGMDPVKVLAFHAPEHIQERVEFLLEKKREQALSEREKEELEHYFILEHIVRLAKSRARLRLSQPQSLQRFKF
jgi:ubiquinone biosynthesis protein COQ9